MYFEISWAEMESFEGRKSRIAITVGTDSDSDNSQGTTQEETKEEPQVQVQFQVVDVNIQQKLEISTGEIKKISTQVLRPVDTSLALSKSSIQVRSGTSSRGSNSGHGITRGRST